MANALPITPTLTRSGGTVTAHWAVTGTENLGYFKVVYRPEGSAGAWLSSPALDASAREYSFTAANIAYEAKVEAFDYAGSVRVTIPAPPPPPVESLKTALSADKTGVVVVSAPAGTAKIGVAVMQTLAGAGLKEGITIPYPLTGGVYKPPAGLPVVDMVAQNSGGTKIGGFAGRLQTVPAVVPPPVEEPEEPHHEEPHASALDLGTNAGNWGPGAVTDIGGTGVRLVRLASGKLAEEAPRYKAAGFGVIGLFGEGGSLQSIANEATSWAKHAIEVAIALGLTAVEGLNEPDGDWFWSDAGNIGAIKTIIKALHDQAQALGYKGPILASFDGGKGGGEGTSFGEKCQKEGVYQYAGGVTVHPYGGSNGGAGGALGDRPKCEHAIAVTKLPLWITELGWPTGTGSTGDSQAWTEAQQAANYASFIAWAEKTPGIAAVTFYGYKNTSDSGADQYGVEMHDSSRHKPAFGVLGEACKALNAGAPAHEVLDALELEEPVETPYFPDPFTWAPGEKLTPLQTTEGHL